MLSETFSMGQFLLQYTDICSSVLEVQNIHLLMEYLYYLSSFVISILVITSHNTNSA